MYKLVDVINPKNDVNPLVEFSFFSNSSVESGKRSVPFKHLGATPPIMYKK